MLPLTSKVLVAHALLQLTLRNGAERAVQRLAVQLTLPCKSQSDCKSLHQFTYVSIHAIGILW